MGNMHKGGQLPQTLKLGDLHVEITPQDRMQAPAEYFRLMDNEDFLFH